MTLAQFKDTNALLVRTISQLQLYTKPTSKKTKNQHSSFQASRSGVTMRRSAMILGVNKNTVAHRLKFFGIKCKKENATFLKEKKKTTHLQIDDLETSEHTKCKPLTVSIAVDADTRQILGAEVSVIAAKGLIADFSRQKYDVRKSTHKEGLKNLFEQMKDSIASDALIKSDKHTSYPKFIKDYFPDSTYDSFKRRSETIAGQGEMKKGGNDPLFPINHTCAMFRANISRLIRRTWSTTKDKNRLQDHIDLFIHFYDSYYLPQN